MAACHQRKRTSKTLMQVRPGDQPGYPEDTIESFVGHSSMGLLCPPAKFDEELKIESGNVKARSQNK